MWEPYRNQLIKAHIFYVEQAKERLLSNFLHIEKEANLERDAWVQEARHLIDSDCQDPRHFTEQADEVALEFYGMLSAMRDRTRMSVIAGMYHEWDKQLRNWISSEIGRWHSGDIFRRKVWSVNFKEVMDFFEAVGWCVQSEPFFPHLDACRVLVNVYKHGEGKSAEDLLARYPQHAESEVFTPFKVGITLSDPDCRHLKVTDETLDLLSQSILEFWRGVPENLCASSIKEVPGWFQSTYQKNRQR